MIFEVATCWFWRNGGGWNELRNLSCKWHSRHQECGRQSYIRICQDHCEMLWFGGWRGCTPKPWPCFHLFPPGKIFLGWGDIRDFTLEMKLGGMHLPVDIPSGKLTWLWKITIFNGKIHYKWPFWIAMLVYQRVDICCWVWHGMAKKNRCKTPHKTQWTFENSELSLQISNLAFKNHPLYGWFHFFFL